jgi:hypothetical protein
MFYKILNASSLEEAKKLNPEPGSFVILGGVSPKITEEWKDCEGSSIPRELSSLKHQNVILIKVTERKVKFFNFPEKRSLCCIEPYQEALKKFE